MTGDEKVITALPSFRPTTLTTNTSTGGAGGGAYGGTLIAARRYRGGRRISNNGIFICMTLFPFQRAKR
jgi:hypothetical protein